MPRIKWWLQSGITGVWRSVIKMSVQVSLHKMAICEGGTEA